MTPHLVTVCSPASGLNGKWATKQWRKGTDETVLSVPTLTRIPNVRFLVQAVSYLERAGSGGGGVGGGGGGEGAFR